MPPPERFWVEEPVEDVVVMFDLVDFAALL
jgi:hypothetical protein